MSDIHCCEFTIGSLFRFKDKLPSHLLSSVIYEYKCAILVKQGGN